MPFVPYLNSYVTADAKAGWRAAALRSGCTMAGLLEALGRALNENPARLPRMEAVVEVARTVDVERRGRGES